MKNLKSVLCVLSAALLLFSLVSCSVPTADHRPADILTASAAEDTPAPLEIPVLETIPPNGAENVETNTEIKIVIDKEHPNYELFEETLVNLHLSGEKWERGYSIDINGDKRMTYKYDYWTSTIPLSDFILFPQTDYTVTLNFFENDEYGIPNGTSYSFTFRTKEADESDPSIIVHTEFPTEPVIEQRIDVTYDATPGEGATIEKVSYLRNGKDEKIIYYAGKHAGHRGTLGEGQVKLTDGENDIVFVVVDSNGKTAQYTVETKPYFDYAAYEESRRPISPKYDPDKIKPMEDKEGWRYVTNFIFFVAYENVPLEEVERVISNIGGEFGGKSSGSVSEILTYYVKLPYDGTQQELEALCRQLESEYVDIVWYARLVKRSDKPLTT